MQKTEEQTSLYKSKIYFTLGLFCFLGGCATVRPHGPMVLAREALASAKEVDAPRFAPGFYYKAEEAYRVGMNFFAEKAYEKSIERFNQAREFAEKAENTARLQRIKSGEEAL